MLRRVMSLRTLFIESFGSLPEAGGWAATWAGVSTAALAFGRGVRAAGMGVGAKLGKYPPLPYPTVSELGYTVTRSWLGMRMLVGGSSLHELVQDVGDRLRGEESSERESEPFHSFLPRQRDSEEVDAAGE